MLPVADDNFDNDEHWIIRARYHFRMEDYWRDRALSAEKELENLKHSIELKNRVKKSSK
jgi:hypothetical protein